MKVIRKNSEALTVEKEEVIQYGIEIFINDFLQIAALFSISLVLGVFKYVSVYFLSYGILRIFTGGPHARTRFQCSLAYVFSLSAVLISARYLYYGRPLIFSAIFLFDLILITGYAPGDTEEKPIASRRIKKRLKFSSFVMLALIFTASVLIYRSSIMISNILALSTFPVTFLLSPIGYGLFKCRHSLYQKPAEAGNIQINEGEV
jgi:accessory gene regulator B